MGVKIIIIIIMIRKFVVYVVFWAVVCNVMSVKLHQVRKDEVKEGEGNGNEIVKICFENGKCSDVKYTARFLVPKQQVVLDGGVQMQKEVAE